MEQVSLKIGRRLKEIRKSRRLTLDDTAELTGVSKPMLGQIERGQSSPTINTLWKISTGLKIPLSFFCRQQAEFTIAGLEDTEGIFEEGGGMTQCAMWRFSTLSLMPGYGVNQQPMWRKWRNIFFCFRGQ